jgi:hypothetical protein
MTSVVHHASVFAADVLGRAQAALTVSADEVEECFALLASQVHRPESLRVDLMRQVGMRRIQPERFAGQRDTGEQRLAMAPPTRDDREARKELRNNVIHITSLVFAVQLAFEAAVSSPQSPAHVIGITRTCASRYSVSREIAGD